MAGELQTTLTNMENNSNPFGFGFAARADWVPEDLGLKTLAEDPKLISCTTSVAMLRLIRETRRLASPL